MIHKEVVDGHFVDDGFTHKTFVMLNDLLDDQCVLKAPSLMYEMTIPSNPLELTEDILEEIFDELDEKDVSAKPYFYVGDREPGPIADEVSSAPVDDDCDPVEWVEDDTERVQDPTPSEYECILVNGTDFKGWVSSLPRQDTASNGEA
jgi:hypothetical protein